MDPERGKYFLFIYLFIFNKNRNNDYSFMKSLFTLLQSLNGTEAIKVPRFFFWQGRGGGGDGGLSLKKNYICIGPMRVLSGPRYCLPVL